MSSSGAGPRAAAAAATTALLLAGVCRMVSGLAKEVQGPIFAPVSQVCCCSLTVHRRSLPANVPWKLKPLPPPPPFVHSSALCCLAMTFLAPHLRLPQDAGRRVSFYTLSHVLGLDLQFHLDRKTGEAGRAVWGGSLSHVT